MIRPRDKASVSAAIRGQKCKGVAATIELPQPLLFGFSTAERRSIPTILDHHYTANGRNSLIVTLGSYVSRYRMALYLVLAAATSLSVVWNWNWLTGAEVFRILAALPCTFMMLMCLRRAACWSSEDSKEMSR